MAIRHQITKNLFLFTLTANLWLTPTFLLEERTD